MMVAAKPTRRWDLDRVRTHRFVPIRDMDDAAVCTVCHLVFTTSLWLANMPSCPGPEFRLIHVGPS